MPADDGVRMMLIVGLYPLRWRAWKGDGISPGVASSTRANAVLPEGVIMCQKSWKEEGSINAFI